MDLLNFVLPVLMYCVGIILIVVLIILGIKLIMMLDKMDKVVDNVIIEGNLSILEIDDVPLDAAIDNVLVQDATTGQVKKRSTDKLLEDIGGISYSIDNTSGTLSFKLGKQ